jgi:putative FmdB family regulatory protein
MEDRGAFPGVCFPAPPDNIQTLEENLVPLYEYRCKNCGHQFEKLQSFSAPEEKECPVCHGPVEKLISTSALQFKGSGWYVNDYAGKSRSMKAAADSSSKSSEGSSKSSEGGSAGPATEKPASTSDSKSSSSTPPASSSSKSE